MSYIPFSLYVKEFREIETQNNIQQMINLQQLVIDKWFEERISDIHTISQLPVVKAMDKVKMQQTLETYDQNYPEFNGIVFVNKDGVSEIDTSGQPGIDLTDRIYYHEAKKGKSYVTDVLIGKQSKQAVIIFSAPILDEKYGFQGLIFGAVRLDTLNEVMKKFRFSETGQAYLVNRDGQLLTDLRFPSQSIQQGTKAGFTKNINTDIFHLALQGKKINNNYQDYRGMTVIGDYRWVNEEKWLIIGEIARDDIFAPFNRMISMLMGVLIIILLIGFGITFWLSNRIEQIIHKVLEGAQQMGKAKYGYRIDPASYAHYSIELQELCRTFNQMAEMTQFHMRSVQISEERYRALVEASPNSIVVHQNGKIVYANPKFIQLLKANSIDDLLGRNIIEHVHSDYHEIVQKRMEELENQKPVDLLQEKYVLFDGGIIDVEVIATPIEYNDKPAFQVIIHDISERKLMERELHKSQEQYRSVVENVKEVIFQTDIHGNWTFLNPAWEKITGYAIEESLGTLYLNLVHPEDRERNNELLQPLIEGNNEYCRSEIRYLTKAGKTKWVEMFARVNIDEQGQIIGTSGSLNDITKRKQSEDELRVSEEQFRLLAEYSSDMISLHNAEGKYVYVSPACKDMLQYEEEELVGHNAFDYIHPEDHDTVQTNHQRLFETGYTVTTYRIRRKDGGYVWFESSTKLLHETNLDGINLIVVSRNISERKLAEQKLQEANEILQRLSAIDGLTGVSNRRAFDERMDMEWDRSRRDSKPLSLIMLDIDFFKAYNDTYGHQGGDGCLKQVASVIQETLERSTDLLCRYGGEEFSVILPETDKAGARIIGEKIRKAIETMEIPHAGSSISPWVTVSIGIATMIPSLYTSSINLISHADKAVYQAKKDGRNCVRSYE